MRSPRSMPLLETEMPLTVTDRDARAFAPNFAAPAEQLPLPVPENSPFDRRAALLLFVGSFAYLSLFLRYTAIEPDEGIILQGAQRILQGGVLYRDFFSYLTPGSYYLLALLFKVFGSSFAVARMA